MSKFIPIILSLLLLLLSLTGYTKNFSSSLSRTFEPITSPLIYIRFGLDTFTNNLRSLPTLTRRLKDLERQNQELTAKTREITSLERELSVYRSNTNTKFRLSPVRIISINHQAVISSPELILIKKGQALVSGSTLIGVVTEVQSHTAKIALLTEMSDPLAINLKSDATGNFSAKDLTPQITDIDNSTVLSLGDPVFTKGNDNLPANLLIGKIKKITSKASDPSQTAVINLSGNITDGNLAIIIDF